MESINTTKISNTRKPKGMKILFAAVGIIIFMTVFLFILVMLDKRDEMILMQKEQFRDFKIKISLEYMYDKIMVYKLNHKTFPQNIKDINDNDVIEMLNLNEREDTRSIIDIVTMNIFKGLRITSNTIQYIYCDDDDFALIQEYRLMDWDTIQFRYLAGKNGVALACDSISTDKMTERKCSQLSSAIISKGGEKWDKNNICKLIKDIITNPVDLGDLQSDRGPSLKTQNVLKRRKQ